MDTVGVPPGMWLVLALAVCAALVLVAVVVTGYLRVNAYGLGRPRQRAQPTAAVVLVGQEPARADAA